MFCSQINCDGGTWWEACRCHFVSIDLSTLVSSISGFSSCFFVFVLVFVVVFGCGFLRLPRGNSLRLPDAGRATPPGCGGIAKVWHLVEKVEAAAILTVTGA